MFRTLRALLLFWGLIATYAWTWLLARLLGGRAERFAKTHVLGATRLTRGFASLGGVFIKVGQVLSVVGTFLPKAYAESLETLQDRAKARPFSEVEQRLRVALGPRPLRKFKHIDRRPIAAASLAQVHRAVTHDGRELAVKILYPNIEQWITSDLWVLRSLLPVVRWLFPIAHPERVLDQLEAMLAKETDLSHERANLEKLRAVFADQPNVVVPEVEASLTAKGVLSMSFERGCKITDAEALAAAGISSEALGARIVECYFKMLFEHRLFHADPHPGNFLVRPAGPGFCLVILDYGAVEELTEPLAEGMKEVLEGVLQRSDEAVLNGLATMGFVAEGGDRELLRRVGKEYVHILAGMNLTSAANLTREHLDQLGGYEALRGKLRDVMRNVQYPPGYFYVERTLVLLFGLVGQLAPSKGLIGLLLPYATRVMAKAYATRRRAKQG
ncbi:MAG: AarF/UbiB family protein [Polyangiaceae bacterium]|nr:AarF/UbiB family protein [Polyangiaceae bacterium]